MVTALATPILVRTPGILRRVVGFLAKSVIGLVLVTTPVTAILVLGWLSHAMARTMRRRLARAAAPERTPPCAPWPHFLLAPDWRALLSQAFGQGLSIGQRASLIIDALFGSLWANALRGLQVAFLLFAVTLPAVLLMLLGWWAGWENSFNKGYEQAWVGAAISLAGVAMLIVVMLYLPFAEARLAISGRWTDFFRIRSLRQLLAYRRLSVTGFTLLFALAAIATAGLKIAPLALGNADFGLSAEDVAFYHHIATALAVLAGAVLLRLTAARILASGMMSAAAIGRGELFDDGERALLGKALKPAASANRGALAKTARWTGSRLSAFGAFTLILAFWTAFVIAIYLAQFLNHDWLDWLFHPLIQLPWARGIAVTAHQ